MESSQELAANDNSVLIGTIASVLADSVAHLSGSDLREFETGLLAVANEAVRLVLERRLEADAAGLSEFVSFGGRLYRRHQPGSVMYHTLVGPVRIRRWTYREVGVRNGP